MKVLGMGNALVDVLALIGDDSILTEMGLPKGSMQLIDNNKMSKLNVAIADVEKFIASGGSASNTITAMAELGVETGFLGKIGNDFYGDYYKRDLEKYKVKSHLTEVDAHSGVATTLISSDGERTFGTYLGAAADLTPEDLKLSDFVGYDYFYIEGYLVQNLDLIRTAVKLAKEAGLKVVLDMASYNVVEDNRGFLLEIIPQYVDIAFANEEEAKALLQTDVQSALSILSKQLDIIIIKEGASGSWVQEGEKIISIPTNKIDRVDTTGAGDMYAAGFLFGLLNGLPHETSGKIGNHLAESVIQVVGAKLDEVKWREVKETIKKM